jgi:hypothetical protein
MLACVSIRPVCANHFGLEYDALLSSSGFPFQCLSNGPLVSGAMDDANILLEGTSWPQANCHPYICMWELVDTTSALLLVQSFFLLPIISNPSVITFADLQAIIHLNPGI